MDDARLNMVGGDRLRSRQIDELIGLTRGVAADGSINQAEVEFLQTWLAANLAISDQPIMRILYDRIADILRDGVADKDECDELLRTLESLAGPHMELGEVLKSTSLPFCDPAPVLSFTGRLYCFTGTFSVGQRRHCEAAVAERGGACGTLSRKTDVLVVGLYATESWKHSSFGNKILKAVELRDEGHPIRIIAEKHWSGHL